MRLADSDQHDGAEEGGLAWLLRQEEHLRRRIEQLALEATTIREYESRRARLCWDQDRRLEAEELGQGLSKKPALVRSRLGQTRQGTLWLLDRWTALGNLLRQSGEWTDAQNSLAFDLLGIPEVLRSGDPWTVAGVDSAQALVAHETSTLRSALSRTLEPLDALERAEAMEGRPVTPPTELKRVQREEAACWRRLLVVQRLIEKERNRAGEHVADDATEPEFEPIPPPAAPARPSLPPSPIRPVAATEMFSPSSGKNRRARRAAMSAARRGHGEVRSR